MFIIWIYVYIWIAVAFEIDNTHNVGPQFILSRSGVASPAGPTLAGPLFSGTLVSFPDCRDSLRTRRLGQVSHTSSPLPCVYAFLAIVPALLPADQEPSVPRPDCIAKCTCVYDVQLLEIRCIPLLAVVLLLSQAQCRTPPLHMHE